MPAIRRRLLSGLAGLAGLAALAAAAPLAGCGFQLRGASRLDFDTFHADFSSGSQLGAELRRAVRNAGARVVDRPADAQVRMSVLAEVPEREIAAFATSGRPREYTLRLRLRFRLRDANDRDLAPESEIILRRRMAVNDALGTVNADEESLLQRDMQADMVQQLIRRLAALKRPG